MSHEPQPHEDASINRRDAIKLAAGASALASVLGFSVSEAAAAQEQGQVNMKLEFYAGGDRPSESISMSQATVDHLMKGDLGSMKFTWWSWGREQEPRQIASHPLDPRAREAIMKLRGDGR